MNNKSPLLVIKPRLRISSLFLPFLIYGFLFVFLWAIIFVTIIIITSNPFLSLISGFLGWFMGLLIVLIISLKNTKNSKYCFFRDYFTHERNNKITKKISYNDIGHIYFKDNQTFLIKRKYLKSREIGNIRIDVEKTKGKYYLQQILNILRTANPARVFSYEIDDKLDYSDRFDFLSDNNFQFRGVKKIRSEMSKKQIHSSNVYINDYDDPSFKITRPYYREGGYSATTLLLSDRESLLLAFELADISKQMKGWNYYEIYNKDAVKIGYFKKHRTLSPIDEFELNILGEAITLKGDLFHHKYNIALNDIPIGTMTDPFWFNVFEKKEIEINQTLNVVLATSLILGLNKFLLNWTSHGRRRRRGRR